MHEMAVTQHLMNLALEHADGHRVTDIYLEVGRMSAIVPDSVGIFFRHLSEGSMAEGAELHFKIMPMEMTCQDCGEPVDLSEWENEPRPPMVMARAIAKGCQNCGSKNLRVTGGVGFEMISIDVE